MKAKDAMLPAEVGRMNRTSPEQPTATLSCYCHEDDRLPLFSTERCQQGTSANGQLCCKVKTLKHPVPELGEVEETAGTPRVRHHKPEANALTPLHMIDVSFLMNLQTPWLSIANLTLFPRSQS